MLDIPKSYDNIPYSNQVTPFIGRDEILKKLEDQFTFNKDPSLHPKVVVLRALGGQGKTQVALELCRRLQSRSFGRFWVNSASKASADKHFSIISNELDKNVQLGAESVTAFVKQTLQSWKDPWLLVFDNYDDPSDASGFNIKEYFPLSKPPFCREISAVLIIKVVEE